MQLIIVALWPDTVRAPDACFVSHERLNTVEETRSYLPLAPDLVIEVSHRATLHQMLKQKLKNGLMLAQKLSWIRRRNPKISENEGKLRFIELNCGQEIADGVRACLSNK